MSKEKTTILFTAFEAAPFMKTGGLGDVAGSLPAYIQSEEYEIRVVLPLIDVIPEKYKEQMTFRRAYNVPLGWRNQHCGLYELEKDGVIWYFLDNEYYFNRGKVYGEFDDGERVAFFSKAVLETILYLDGFEPDIIHCNDWHTALLPVFLHEQYRSIPKFSGIKTVFTIHNLKFQGAYDPYIIGDVLGLQNTPAAHQLMFDGACNYMLGAITYADAVTTVSPTYVENICSPEYGEGLEYEFLKRRDKMHGIINGIDFSEYNPETDPALEQTFTLKNMEGKKQDKAALQKKLGLPVKEDTPLFTMVTRMTPQKGMDMVMELLPEFAEKNMQLAVLGTGALNYEEYLKEQSLVHPDKISATIAFNEALSREFYAGADVFMMPSVFEPCGLAQMMAMRYGTLPLVRETGGLRDTVDGYSDAGEKATGFSFKDADAQGLRFAVEQAIDLWEKDQDMWKRLQQNAMEKDFSWPNSAAIYKELYRNLK